MNASNHFEKSNFINEMNIFNTKIWSMNKTDTCKEVHKLSGASHHGSPRTDAKAR